MAGVSAVFVDGFDFGTSKDDIESHMSQAGTVDSVQLKKGNAVVTYSSADEAELAVATLNKTTIEGNSRFIDVKIDKKSLPPLTGMKRSSDGGQGGSTRVLVRGFDFDTSDEQLEAHMGKVGVIQELHWVSKGSANVVYSDATAATAAINTLHGTVIPGNSRFIDVIIGGDRAAEKKSKGGGKGWGAGWTEMGEYPIPWMQKMSKGKGTFKGGGKGKRGDHSDEDPAGSARVFVRGFDFGTTDQQLENHMKQAGLIHTIHWVNQGNAVVVYMNKGSAAKACSSLDKTTIPGNSRYIEVAPRS
eukprot:gnl/MRDRNA2_/MRDRNA2_74072_c0_seq3.p1 gnl/MRDRNA2_/MRDRNA2_74072_c0~~gnl/MRDRNA2_/MRDRNA2_74072_c0_seq3.p1  ORF type:complete len:329 (+),score=57.18 gnl/MRDRNA2_/MRDRNA2_74072_c0_seq3:84-989(+)